MKNLEINLLKMKITAVIPVRKGSQRVRDKNLRTFADSNLLTLKIRTLQKVKGLTEIIVNTDSEEAIVIAENNGVRYHRRELYYASSQCSGSEFFEHLGKVTDTDVFAYCPPTSPFVKPETMEKAIEMFLNDTEHDCLSTVSIVKDFLWLDGKAVNYDPKNAPNSQNLPDMEALNFGFTLVKRDNMIKNRNIIGKKPLFIRTSDVEAIDIDTPLDFFLAEQLYMRLAVEQRLLQE